MVLLTMTKPMVEVIHYVNRLSDPFESKPEEPPLDDPAVGKPISHGQILELFERLQTLRRVEKAANECPTYHLDDLLRSSRIYIEPPKPKPEQVQLNTFDTKSGASTDLFPRC